MTRKSWRKVSFTAGGRHRMGNNYHNKTELTHHPQTSTSCSLSRDLTHSSWPDTCTVGQSTLSGVRNLSYFKELIQSLVSFVRIVNDMSFVITFLSIATEPNYLKIRNDLFLYSNIYEYSTSSSEIISKCVRFGLSKFCISQERSFPPYFFLMFFFFLLQWPFLKCMVRIQWFIHSL